MAVEMDLKSVGAVGMDVSTGAINADIPLTSTPGLNVQVGEAKLVQGPKGDAGGYYRPNLDEEGNLTFAASEANMPGVEGANIRGPKGKAGKSAYELAKEAGYTGTAEEFSAEQAAFADNAAKVSAAVVAAEGSATQAASSASSAASSANAASASASSADASAQSAESSAGKAVESANKAFSSETNAKASEAAAGIAMNAAAASESVAATSATSAGQSATAAQRAQAAAEDAIRKTARIGENGNWYQWDVAVGALVDTGIPATGVADENSGERVRLWFGTIEEYNALATIESDVLYHILEGRVVS